MAEDGDDSHSQNQNESVERELDDLLPPPSNKKLLYIAFISFQSFAIVQLGAAIFAGSEAMLGDSVAMMVDALTYLFNLIAERKKEKYASKLKQQNSLSSPTAYSARGKIVLEYLKYTYQLELIPPLLSVSTLLVVTILVLKQSIHTLVLDGKRDASLQSDPNLNLMVIFSALNLILDVVNVGCFVSASHAFGYKTDTEDHHQVTKGTVATEQESYHGNNVNSEFDSDVDSDEDNDDSEGAQKSYEEETSDEEDTSSRLHSDHLVDGNNGDSTNLNMCSAYTHVFADTLRSFAVIIASLLAEFTNTITPEVADAAAAVVVSMLIFASLFPLFGGMIQTFKALRDVNMLLKMKESEGKEEEDQVELVSLI